MVKIEQEKLIKSILEKDYYLAINEFPDHSDEIDFKRVQRYYVIGLGIYGYMIATIQNVAVSNTEKEILTYTGALAAYADDIIDSGKYSDERIHQLFYNPENCNPNTALEFLVLNYYKIIVSKVQNPSQFLDILKKAIQYQLESVSQRNKNISVAEVQKLSNQKAGYAHLLFSSVMPIRFDEIDQKFIYQTGVLTQYGNDLFDYYKDIQENHQSLFTVEDSIEKVYLDFKQVLEKMLELQIECGYQESKIKAFNRMLAIPLSTFIIAFEQLSELEKTNKRDFENGKLERKLYITDMETWGNRIKLIRNYYLHPLIQRLTR